MKIDFEYTNKVSTHHPDFQIVVTFKCEAIVVRGNKAEILSIKAAAYTPSGSTAWQQLSIPPKGSLFAALLREKAREAAKKWQAENF
jgi:hypothetical protein